MSMKNVSPLVASKQISFSWHGASTLIDVTMEVLAGDFLAIIGPNGSGKSTLIKIFLGLLQPTAGVIQLFGQPPDQFEDWAKIGYVPQKATHIDPYFPVSVKEVLAMALLSRRPIPAFCSRQDLQAIDEALTKVGMQRHHKRLVGELSGGEQQRVFIARAIVHKPEILFLDEPTTGIDFHAQQQFYAMLDELNSQQGMAIVLVTHDIGAVTKHVKKLACLNQRLCFHGTHAEFCACDVAQSLFPGDHHRIDHSH